MAKDYRFTGQKDGEQVLLMLRRHWITFLAPLSLTLVIFIVPLLAWLFFFPQLNLVTLSTETLLLGAAIWTFLAFIFGLINFLDWYLDIYLVTNMRVIDITQNGLFHRKVGETTLDHVQDVIYDINGIIPTIFNYGDVKIHTAGPSGDIDFEQVHAPQEVQRYLLKEVDDYKETKAEKIATPEDLLNMMLSHEKAKLLKSSLLQDQLMPPDVQPGLAAPTAVTTDTPVPEPNTPTQGGA